MTMPKSDKKLEEFAELYSQLTLKEVTALQKLIFKKMGHSDDFYEQALLRGLGGGGGGAAVVMPAQLAAAVAPAAQEESPKEEAAAKPPAAAKTSFDVKVGKFPAEAKIKLIKELRAITNLPLKEAKDAIDKAPGIVSKSMGKEDAEKLKEKLVALGAEVELL